MAIISEISGDSKDGDPSKKPQEVAQNPLTKRVLYALIGFPNVSLPYWYILNKTDETFHLSIIGNLNHMTCDSAVVINGFHMYVIGGSIGHSSTPAMLRMDLRTHEIQVLPPMRRIRRRPAAAVFEGNIYVIGGCEIGLPGWAEVFNVNTQLWTSLPSPHTNITYATPCVTCAVMEDKIYVLDPACCFTYDLRENRWETLLDPIDRLRSLWQQCSCVVDDVLYTLDTDYPRGILIAFDPKEKYWRPVTLSGPILMPEFLYFDAKMANCGGNLVILGGKDGHKELWCIEITLTRREDGEFRGTIVKVQLIATSEYPVYIEHCRAPTV